MEYKVETKEKSISKDALHEADCCRSQKKHLPHLLPFHVLNCLYFLHRFCNNGTYYGDARLKILRLSKEQKEEKI